MQILEYCEEPTKAFKISVKHKKVNIIYMNSSTKSFFHIILYSFLPNVKLIF